MKIVLGLCFALALVGTALGFYGVGLPGNQSLLVSIGGICTGFGVAGFFFGLVEVEVY